MLNLGCTARICRSRIQLTESAAFSLYTLLILAFLTPFPLTASAQQPPTNDPDQKALTCNATFGDRYTVRGQGWSLLSTVSLSLGDMNGDGLPEVLVSGDLKNRLVLYRNESAHGTIAFASGITLPIRGLHQKPWGTPKDALIAPSTSRSGTIAMVRQTTAETLFVRASYVNGAKGETRIGRPHVQRYAGTYVEGLTFGELDRSGQRGFLTVGSDLLRIFELPAGRPIAYRGKLAEYQVPLFTPRYLAPTDAILADLNQDGLMDVAVGAGSTIRYFIQSRSTDGKLSLQANSIEYPDSGVGQAGDIAATDLNGDSFPDLVITDRGINLFMNDGTGTLVPSAKIPLVFAAEVSGIAVGDLNGDGLNDLLLVGANEHGYHSSDPSTYHPERPNIALLYGTLSAEANYLSEPQYLNLRGFALRAQIADLDGDGRNDVILACRGSTAILKIIRNTTKCPKVPAQLQ